MMNQSTNTHKNKRTWGKWLRIATLVGGWIPLAIYIIQALFGNLGFNPAETILQRTGRTAIIFLILTLAITPIRKIFKLSVVGRLRKPLGLFTALYAALHFATFAIWDYQLNLALIWNEIIGKPFIIFGVIALVILLALAATSFRYLQRKWGKAWKWLHRLVYVAGIMAVIHYLLSIKGDLFNLQGDFTLPFIALVVVSLLLMVRVQAFYHFIQKWFIPEK